MRAIMAIVSFSLLAAVIVDAVETVVVARHGRDLPWMTRAFYRLSWIPYRFLGRFIRLDVRREHYLGIYGPVSLLLLLGIWAFAMIVAFGLLRWSAGFRTGDSPANITEAIYFSATTFFTLGTGEPQSSLSKFLMVLEAASGFSFLGLVIGYLPVLYESFSERERRILLLDAQAGSPPSAATLLLRLGDDPTKLEQRLANWEEWALELLQTHLSYPMLAYYRSQHANQSWLAALTVVADVSAIVAVSAEGELKRQAEFTFAASRHALAHTASIFRLGPRQPKADRLPAQDAKRLCDTLMSGQTVASSARQPAIELVTMRESYEPFAEALSAYFLMELPGWEPSQSAIENWKIASWRS